MDCRQALYANVSGNFIRTVWFSYKRIRTWELLGLVVPTLIIFLPIMILGLIRLIKKGINRIQFGIAILGCFLIGLVVPIFATMVSAGGLTYNFGPDDPKCAIGAAVFFMLGHLINLIGLPIAGLIIFPWKRRTGS